MLSERFGYVEFEFEIMLNGVGGDKWKDMMSLFFEVCNFFFFRVYMDYLICVRLFFLFYFFLLDLFLLVNFWNIWCDGEFLDVLMSFLFLFL